LTNSKSFWHESPLGDAPAQKLFELVNAHLLDGVETPRSYSDYAITSLEEVRKALPARVSVEDLVGG